MKLLLLLLFDITRVRDTSQLFKLSGSQFHEVAAIRIDGHKIPTAQCISPKAWAAANSNPTSIPETLEEIASDRTVLLKYVVTNETVVLVPASQIEVNSSATKLNDYQIFRTMVPLLTGNLICLLKVN